MSYKEQVKFLVMEQFKNSSNLLSLIEIFAEKNDEIAEVLNTLENCFDIDTSTKAQLDMLGNLVGETRDERNDDDYRIAIKFRIFLNCAQGVPEDLLECAKTLTSASKIQYMEIHPAKIHLTIYGGNIPDNLKKLLKSIAPIGVGLSVAKGSLNPFCFYGDPQGSGFGSLTDSTKGGEFVSLV